MLSCPKCRSENLRRSHLFFYDLPLLLLLFIPIRCRDYHARFYSTMIGRFLSVDPVAAEAIGHVQVPNLGHRQAGAPRFRIARSAG